MAGLESAGQAQEFGHHLCLAGVVIDNQNVVVIFHFDPKLPVNE
jgi:hypothetical protein